MIKPGFELEAERLAKDAAGLNWRLLAADLYMNSNGAAVSAHCDAV